MMKTISEPRAEYKEFVPRMVQLIVDGEFIGAIIGKGGETIQKIQRETGTTITITEQQIDGAQKGVVDIFGLDKESMDKAISWINGITAVPEVDAVYHGKIVSILEFGAFVEILPGKEGLLHVSEIDWKKTEKVEDVLAIGDEVDVKLLEIDAKTGKMRLSRKALIEKPEGYVEPERKPRGGDRGPRREERRDNGRGPRRDDRGPRRDDRGPRGPRRDRREEPAQNETNNEPEMF
jgi:polyribonucleotide nucleotidyltransferase